MWYVSWSLIISNRKDLRTEITITFFMMMVILNPKKETE